MTLGTYTNSDRWRGDVQATDYRQVDFVWRENYKIAALF